MDIKNRQERFRSFAQFHSTATDIFEALKNSEGSHSVLNQYYKLCICPGGWNGGTDPSRVEIFYGQRPAHSVVEDDPKIPFGKLTRLLTESGAWLTYQRVPTGMVLCFLEPATLEGVVPSEDVISLGLIKNPDSLLKGKLTKKHWIFLNAYMECTCIDGTPSLKDRIIVSWLRLVNTLIIKKEIRKPRILTFFAEILKYSLTVGFSGCLLFLITFCLLPPSIQKVSVTSMPDSYLHHQEDIENKLRIVQSDLDNERADAAVLSQGLADIKKALEEIGRLPSERKYKKSNPPSP